MTVLLILLGLVCGIGATYLILRPKLIISFKEKEKLDLEVSYQEARLSSLEDQNSLLEAELQSIEHQCLQKEKENDILTFKLENLQQLCKQADDNYYEKISLEQEKINKAKEEFLEEYALVMRDAAIQLSDSMEIQILKVNEAKDTINKFQSLAAAAIEDLKREELKKTQGEFYKLQIPQQDLEDIHQLRKIAETLNNREVLNKLIWKTYFEKPTNDLIGRQISKPTTGIYKIQDIENGKVYIGQAANISDRWKQHIKRGLHAETPLNNKLYPALWEKGVENFSFEIMEECARTELNEREKFWIEYFDSKNWGYNVTGGNG